MDFKIPLFFLLLAPSATFAQQVLGVPGSDEDVAPVCELYPEICEPGPNEALVVLPPVGGGICDIYEELCPINYSANLERQPSGTTLPDDVKLKITIIADPKSVFLGQNGIFLSND